MIKDKWAHQNDAIQRFLEKKQGILEMATGTGKTRTAICIMKELYAREIIDQVVIVAYGNDLLDQWYKELLLNIPKASE